MTKLHELEIIRPDWAAPVGAAVTTRNGGLSQDGYAGLNLADHVGDVAVTVQQNRSLLQQALSLKCMPVWLLQVHGSDVVCADEVDGAVAADAAWTAQPHTVCTVLTADCLPVLFCDRAGTRVAAAHAGWRGLCAGVLENTLDSFSQAGIAATDIMVWLGPAIGPDVYEVDRPVRDAFLRRDREFATAFAASRAGHWRFDIYAAARHVLARRGVTDVSGGGFCTYTEPRFFSYRREPVCGRQATLIWISNW